MGVDQLIGQDRAMDAIRLAAGVRHADFNLFVQGSSGMGRRRAVMELLREQAGQRPTPCDWVYVNNFEAPHKPRALKLAPGRALEFKSAMEELVDDLAIEIPAMFDSEDYQAQRRALEQEYGQRQETAMAEFAERAKSEKRRGDAHADGLYAGTDPQRRGGQARGLRETAPGRTRRDRRQDRAPARRVGKGSAAGPPRSNANCAAGWKICTAAWPNGWCGIRCRRWPRCFPITKASRPIWTRRGRT
ncbi:Lon-like protease helical domain-containing protein [Jhaorihella thermophila]